MVEKQQCPKLALWLSGRKVSLYDWTLHLLSSSWDLQVCHKSLWYSQLLWLACSHSLASNCCCTTAHPLCLRDVKQPLGGTSHHLIVGFFLLRASITKSGPQHRGLNTIWKENTEIVPLMLSTESCYWLWALAHSKLHKHLAGWQDADEPWCWGTKMRWQSPLETFCSLPLRYLLISHGNKPLSSTEGESKLYIQMMVQWITTGTRNLWTSGSWDAVLQEEQFATLYLHSFSRLFLRVTAGLEELLFLLLPLNIWTKPWSCLPFLKFQLRWKGRFVRVCLWMRKTVPAACMDVQCTGVEQIMPDHFVFGSLYWLLTLTCVIHSLSLYFRNPCSRSIYLLREQTEY